MIAATWGSDNRATPVRAGFLGAGSGRATGSGRTQPDAPAGPGSGAAGRAPGDRGTRAGVVPAGSRFRGAGAER
jgi:hypothetical protein